jgi:hypothetical protein
VISVIGAGGDCSFAVVRDRDSVTDPVDRRRSNPFSEIATLTSEIVDQVSSVFFCRSKILARSILPHP